MAMTWEELVADVTARHPLRCQQSRHLRVPAGSVEPTPVKQSKMFGMPCLKRENGKVVAGYWKDGGITVKLVDEAQREAALALTGAQLFDPGMGRVMREWVHVPAAHSDDWERLVEQAVG
jgi:hypothetical protein